MSPEAFGIIFSGVFIFILVAGLLSWCSKRRKASHHSVRKTTSDWCLPVNVGVLISFVVFEVIVLVWSMIVIMNAYPAETLPGSIGIYNSVVKFTDEGADIFLTPLSQMRSITIMMGYVFAFYLAQSFALKDKQGRVIQICGFLLACLFQLANASRTAAVGYIVCLVISYYILKRKMTNNRSIVSVRTVLAFGGAAFLFIVTFQPIAEIIQGRTTSTNSFSYFSAYIGAQFPNLDTFIHYGDNHEGEGIFGYMTFRNTIRWIGMQFGIPSFIYQYDLPFNTMNGVSTGNVYTTFYAFLYDFGIPGCIVLTAVMAAISQLIYQKCNALNSGSYSGFWVIVYTMVAYALILCFFSNKFYENIFTIGMVYRLVYLFILFWVVSFFSKKRDKNCR